MYVVQNQVHVHFTIILHTQSVFHQAGMRYFLHNLCSFLSYMQCILRTRLHLPQQYHPVNIDLFGVTTTNTDLLSCRTIHFLASRSHENSMSRFLSYQIPVFQNSTLAVCVVIKSPPWVLRVNGWVFVLPNLIIYFSSTIEELNPESSIILRE